MVVVALVRFSGCKDSPVLVDVGELQVRELRVENPLDLSFALDVVHHCVSAQDCFHTLIALSMLRRVICQQMQDSTSNDNILVQPRVVWQARYVSSSFHRCTMEPSPLFFTHFVASLAFQWSCCHWVCPCFAPRELSSLTVQNGTDIISKCVLIFLFCSSEGIRHTPKGNKVTLRCVFQAPLALNGLGNLSQLIQFYVSQFSNCTF